MLASVAACGGSSNSSATFSGKSDAQLERAIVAATDGDVVFAELVASADASAPPGGDTCPTIATTGNEVDVTGGCTTSDGTKITGSAKLVDVPPLLSGSGAAPTTFSMDFDQLASTGSDGVLSFDGTVDGNAGVLTADLDDTLLGIGAHVDMSLSCGSASGQCTVGDGASIDVDGIGAATVTGSWAGDQSTMAVTVTGAETMTLSAANGCVVYAIDGGASGRFCNNSGSGT
nr:hypothetical protein [Kofleriaceae bacterium]